MSHVVTDLFWTGHTPLSPVQATRWSWVVAYAQLHLVRVLAIDHRLPWEKPGQGDLLSPGRVRRVFRRVTAGLPSPARSPKPATPGPGRPKGGKNRTTRPRYPVIKKGRPDNTGHRKGKVHAPTPKLRPASLKSSVEVLSSQNAKRYYGEIVLKKRIGETVLIAAVRSDPGVSEKKVEVSAGD